MLTADTARALCVCLLAGGWLRCAPCVEDPAGCPERQYHPTGEAVASADSCIGADDECAFICDEETCAGVAHAITCEPCLALDFFANGDCEDCRVGFQEGATTFQCVELK